MTAEGFFTCPICAHECRSNSVLYPECGVQFENWLKNNPDKTIPEWKLSSKPQSHEPAPVPVVAPPEQPMTPEAQEAQIVLEMEKVTRLRNSPGVKAGRKAGALMMMLAVGNSAGAVILKAIGMTTSNRGMIMGGVDALILVPLAIGTYMGKKKCGFWGIGYFTLSTIVSLLLPDGEPVNSEINIGAIAAASTVVMNGFVIFSLYWFVKKMEE